MMDFFRSPMFFVCVGVIFLFHQGAGALGIFFYFLAVYLESHRKERP